MLPKSSLVPVARVLSKLRSTCYSWKVFVLAGMAFWLPNFIRLSAQWSAFTGHRRTSFHQLPVSRLMESPGAAAGGCNVLSSHRQLFQSSRAQGDVVFTCKAACLWLRFHITDFCVRLSDMNASAAARHNKKIRLQSEMICEQLGGISECCQLWF